MNLTVLDYIAEHRKLCETTLNKNAIKLEEVANNIILSLKLGGKIYVAGNGGSCSQAEHLVGEMVGRLKNKHRKAYNFECLTSNNSTLTALANDKGYENALVEQLKGRFTKYDMFIGLSTSGYSKNICRVVEYINNLQDKDIDLVNTVILTGNDENSPVTTADKILFVDSFKTEMVQDIHQIYIHILAKLVEEEMK